jgi:hypothetical protein
MGTTKKNKKGDKKKTNTSRGDEALAIVASNYHQTQHRERDSQKALPPRRKQCTSVVVAQLKILGFHPAEHPSFQNNTFSKAIAR